MKAIKSNVLGRPELVDGVAVPSVVDHPDYVLVKTQYLGVNHCDYVFADLEMLFVKGLTLGCEYVGEVVEVGANCRTRFRRGDRIAGCAFPSGTARPECGTHAEYALARGDAAFNVAALGPGVEPAQAAGLGIPFATAFTSLYHHLKLAWPGDEAAGTTTAAGGEAGQKKKTILIYGGSTNTGLIAIQFAKLSGWRVLTTCSPRNFELVRSLGADAAFDYRDAAECAAALRAAGAEGPERGLRTVLDCVGLDGSRDICAAVVEAGGVYASIAPWAFAREDVTRIFVEGEQVLGERYLFGSHEEAPKPELVEQWRRFLPVVERLIAEGRVRLTQVKLIKGMDKIPDALQELREWKLSATKLVCEV